MWRLQTHSTRYLLFFSLSIYNRYRYIYFKFNNVLLYNYAGVIELNINQLTGSYRSIFT